MNNNIAISVSNVSKCYHVFENQRARLRHALWPRSDQGRSDVWSLRDINFEVERGDSVAIIGRNGSGKSTLLEIITGTLTPTSGEARVQGRVAALLELGSGFNPEYTGRENVMLNGLLLGLSRSEILSRFGEIEAFAEIGAAIDRPVKTYSSGMVMRLAFAVQVLCEPDILIIDEALSVGDFFFQQKCFSHIRDMCAKGVTLLFVSHDMGTVRDLCSRVIYLKQGALEFDGASSSGISFFFKETSAIDNSVLPSILESTSTDSLAKERKRQKFVEDFSKQAIWSAPVSSTPGKLIAVSICGQDSVSSTSFQIGDRMVIGVLFKQDLTVINHVSVVITDKFGAVITTTGSLSLKVIDNVGGSDIRYFELEMDLMIESGQYGVLVSLGCETEKNRGRVLDESGILGPITVIWNYEKDVAPFYGKVGLPVSARYKEIK